jgi:AcrR family transcriptional regulator
LALDSIARAWEVAEIERVSSREKQREIKLTALISIASLVLNKKGYEGISLSEIASRLNISKQALYHYTSSKEDLLYKCYQRALDQAERGYDHADSSGTTGLEKIALFVRFQLNEDAPPYASMDNMGALNEAHRQEVSRRAKALERRMRGFIAEGMADGSISPIDPKFTEFWILGSLSWLPKWFHPEGESSLEQIADSFLHLIANGLRPRPQ